VDIHSTPEGAQVLTGEISGGGLTFPPPRVMGVTPLSLNWEIAGDCGQTEAVRVRWASGAEASLPTLRLCTVTGKHQQFTFERPASFTGLDIDLQVAYQQAMLAQMRGLAHAANDPPPPAPWTWTPQPKTSVICVTRQVASGATYVSCQ
jgi:hypothetical protein